MLSFLTPQQAFFVLQEWAVHFLDARKLCQPFICSQSGFRNGQEKISRGYLDRKLRVLQGWRIQWTRLGGTWMSPCLPDQSPWWCHLSLKRSFIQQRWQSQCAAGCIVMLGFCAACPWNGTPSKGMIKINLQRARERRRKRNASPQAPWSFTSKVPVLHLSLYTKAQELVLTVLSISGHRCSARSQMLAALSGNFRVSFFLVESRGRTLLPLKSPSVLMGVWMLYPRLQWAKMISSQEQR